MKNYLQTLLKLSLMAIGFISISHCSNDDTVYTPSPPQDSIVIKK
ncbi:hypothetical protein [Apibacter muscae]|nr:hypothetical protein [Apibacter muscae]